MNDMQEDGSSSPDREFASLPRRVQIARLRRLAWQALDAYDLPSVRLTLLIHLFNTTFLVNASTGERYVLRIHRARIPTVESVNSELEWLAALRRDTSLEVPSPVPTRHGALLTVATGPEMHRPHICVLFRWLPGRILRRGRGLTPLRMERVGELMAHLQLHAAHWERPPGFIRGRVDYPIESARWLHDPFAPEVIGSIGALVADSLSTAEATLVTTILQKVRVAEQTLRSGATEARPTFGLMHADLHYRNLLFARDTVRAIDFDDCGFGPLLYDPAVMLNEINDWPEYPVLRAALLSGYRRVRPLDAEQEAYLDTFIALRGVQDALWVLEWRKHAAIPPDWAAMARRSLAASAAALAGEPGAVLHLA